jgi:murein DD-endopeptidase MepM/ murein hydrolase activator NlpD
VVSKGGVAGRWCLVLVGFIAFACGGSGVYHRVNPGETLSDIGAAYRVPYSQIARANKMRDPSRIYVGQRLWIPGAEEEVRVSLARKSSVQQRRSSSRVRPEHAPSFRWPIEHGVLSSRFGRRGKAFHDGIDIAAPIGAAVRAAAAGEVVYDQSLSGYGKVIILRHGHGYSTVYAHNDVHYVRRGERVETGQLIAGVGRTGRATGPNLHFEVRLKNIARDPLLFLPARG